MSTAQVEQASLPGIVEPTVGAPNRDRSDGIYEQRRYFEQFQDRYLSMGGRPLNPDVVEALKSEYVNWKSVTRAGLLKGSGNTRGALAVLSTDESVEGRYRIDALIVDQQRSLRAASGQVSLSKTEATESASVALSHWISSPAARMGQDGGNASSAGSVLSLALSDPLKAAEQITARGFDTIVAAAEKASGLGSGSIEYEPFVVRKFSEANCHDLHRDLLQKVPQLTSAVDPALWASAQAASDPISALEFVAAAPNERVKTYRSQAIESFSWLPWKSIASNESVGAKEGLAAEIAQCIDAGQSMKQFLAERFNVPKPLYKRLVNKTREELGDEFYSDPLRCVQVAALIDPNHLPTGPIEWDAFARVAKPLAEISEFTATPPKVGINGLIKPSKGQTWENLESRLALAIGQRESSGLLEYLASNVREAATTLSATIDVIAAKQRVVVPGGAAGDLIAPLVLSNKRLDTLAKVESSWREVHTNALMDADLQAQESSTSSIEGQERWPSLVKGKSLQMNINGQTRHAVELVSSDELRAEGTRMHHCVGTFGYAARCAQGGVRIFSLRASKDDAGTTTLELRQSPNKDETEWAIVQNRASRNGAPPMWAQTMASDLVAGINDGSIANRRVALAKHYAVQAEGGGSAETRAIADYNALIQRYYVDRLSDTADAFLPKRFSGKPLTDFVTDRETLEAVGGRVMKSKVDMLF